MSDLRLAGRQLVINPGFTWVAGLALALGLGVDFVETPQALRGFFADMKPTSLLPAFTLCAGVLATVAGQEAPKMNDRLQGWRDDIDFLEAAVVREHYRFKTEPLPASFRNIAEELKAAISGSSDLRMLVGLQRLMATLGDGHCYATPSPKFIQRLQAPPEELPLRLHRFSDGLFVIDANPGSEKWINRRLTRIGPVPADEALRRMADYVPKDNPYSARWRAPEFLGYRSYLEAVGCVESEPREIMLGFATADGTAAAASIAFVPFAMAARPALVPSRVRGAPEPPLHLRHVSSHFWFEAVPSRETTYVQVNQVQDSPNESLEAFAARLDSDLRRSPPRLLGIDVRYNGGGNADLLPPLVRVIREFEAREPKGKVVILIGPGTFSAAQIFISMLDRDSQATFAGEPSGSKPNFVGEHNPVELPWSGVIVNLSNRRHVIIPGDQREWIEPELKVELSSGDYFANRDPVWEAVLTRYAAPAKSRNSTREMGTRQ